jgi:hypothetical protein
MLNLSPFRDEDLTEERVILLTSRRHGQGSGIPYSESARELVSNTWLIDTDNMLALDNKV